MASYEFTPDELATEEWREIPGYEGRYSVSNLGRVRRDAPSPKQGAAYTYPGRLLRPSLRAPGNYLVVSLYKENKQKTPSVHQLVAWTFLGIPPAGYQVNHKDANKMNNRLCNLEWTTPAKNSKHASILGLYCSGDAWRNTHPKETRAKGLWHRPPKLTEAKVHAIRQRYATGAETYDTLAEAYGVTRNYIYMIVTRRRCIHT